MLALVLVAVSVGLSNFAGALGIGVAGTGPGTRLRVGLVFGLYETAMPLVGLVLGHGLAEALGHAAHWISAGLLIAIGGYAAVRAIRASGGEHRVLTARGARLLLTGFALSLDNLAVGFALGAYHVPVLLAAIIIGAVSVTLSLAGLELGGRLGARTGERGELLGGLVLVGVGVLVAAGKL